MFSASKSIQMLFERKRFALKQHEAKNKVKDYRNLKVKVSIYIGFTI